MASQEAKGPPRRPVPKLPSPEPMHGRAASAFLPRKTMAREVLLQRCASESVVEEVDPETAMNTIGYAANEVWVVLRLTGALLWALNSSTMWMVMAARLLVYVAVLFPAFLRMIWHWGFSTSVIRGVVYGPARRNRVDVYTLSPEFAKLGTKRPVVVFMTGGAWIIGYKAWGALMGMVLQRQGVLFLAPDYRNFPQGTVEDMLDDTEQAVEWAFQNCERYGGDPENLYLIGQSAGAHLAATAVLRRCQAADKGASQPLGTEDLGSLLAGELDGAASAIAPEDDAPEASAPSAASPARTITWRPNMLKAYMGISGPYDLVALQEHFHNRGLDRSIFARIFPDAAAVSPSCIARAWKKLTAGIAAVQVRPPEPPKRRLSPEAGAVGDAVAGGAGMMLSTVPELKTVPHPAYLLPPMLLVHGDRDASVPYTNAEDFGKALRELRDKLGLDLAVGVKLYEGKTHTDPILEDPMGGDDLLMEDIVYLVLHKDTAEAVRDICDASGDLEAKKSAVLTRDVAEPMVYHFVVDFARWVNPF